MMTPANYVLCVGVHLLELVAALYCTSVSSYGATEISLAMQLCDTPCNGCVSYVVSYHCNFDSLLSNFNSNTPFS